MYGYRMSNKSGAEKNLKLLLDELRILNQHMQIYHADGAHRDTEMVSFVQSQA